MPRRVARVPRCDRITNILNSSAYGARDIYRGTPDIHAPNIKGRRRLRDRALVSGRPDETALPAQAPGPARIRAWFAGVVSTASKLSSIPTPAGSLKATWVWFRTGTLLIV